MELECYEVSGANIQALIIISKKPHLKVGAHRVK